ncbi:hypothetical protein [Elizabethkingia anophelis]|uniref:Uncharacterized protein n=1 Tax=Elizabethkingia anophelis TaxID=1117645 RepID=A0AAU8VCS6_9FLAO|nr:hypothetical protein [Elizabethkingia anophelis]AQX00436.1 hypothetical protein BBD32_02630 [Elizabethkingia anophelis]OPB66204.1 hypothetical protein BAY11_14660 [Elizabethkingia anophelis]
MFIEIKEVAFATGKEASENVNYPESGLYLVAADGNTDLRLIDKTVKVNHFICPKSVFDGIMTYMSNPEASKLSEADNTTPPASYVSESFVMDFTRLLLNKK